MLHHVTQHDDSTQGIRVPLVRLGACIMGALAIAAHNIYVLRSFAIAPFAVVTAFLLGYGALSVLLLRRHPGAAWAFHVGDLAVCTVVVYASGAEHSWLFAFLLIPVWNQTHTNAKRAAVSGVLATLFYLAMLLFVRVVEERPLATSLIIFRTIMIAIVTTYCVTSAIIVQRSRRRFTVALTDAQRDALENAATLTALNRLTQAVTMTPEVAPMLDTAAGEMLTLFNASGCMIALIDEKQDALEIVACRATRPVPSAVFGLRIPFTEGAACAIVTRTRRPLIVPEAQTSPMLEATRDALRALSAQSVLVAPIITHSDVIGTINIHTDDPRRRFTDEEAMLATTAAAQVAAPIRNARLYDAERRARLLNERLQQAGREITESLDLNETLERIMVNLRGVLDFDAGSIQLLEGDAMRVLAVHGHSQDEVGRVRDLATHGYNRRLATSPEPVILHLPEADDIWPYDIDFAAVRTVLGLPLIVHNKIIGAMSIDSHKQDAYDQKDAEAAMAFARVAAVAVDHARLYTSVREMSMLDPLTGIPNRRYFDDRLDNEWRRAARNRTPFSVMMIDVDHFKAYNDHHGHAAGDVVLQRVAAALQGALQRATDFVARYGGEEFVAVLPATNLAIATTHAERLRRRIENLAIQHGHSSASTVVTVSIGVATAVAGSADAASLMIAADQQLYSAKRAGRNGVAAAAVVSQESTSSRPALEA